MTPGRPLLLSSTRRPSQSSQESPGTPHNGTLERMGNRNGKTQYVCVHSSVMHGGHGVEQQPKCPTDDGRAKGRPSAQTIRP